METTNTQTTRDESLWRVAKKRAEFKRHLISYILVNIMLWVIWGFTNFDRVIEARIPNFPWPAYVTFFWGIGLAFNFFGAYVAPGHNLEEKEYQKLVEKQRK